MATTANGEGRAAPRALIGLFILVLVSALFLVPHASAAPTGAAVTYVSNTTAGSGSPESRTDPRSTITTITLDAVQQNAFWKAYVGNVTGVLTLDDASGNTIYDWSLTGVTITGEVYVSRNGSLSFTSADNFTCANQTVISTEETFNNMTGVQADSINNTFGYQNHSSFVMGLAPTLLTITANTCPSTATYVNDTAQTVNESAYFQELLIQDVWGNLIYVTFIEDNEIGFQIGALENKTYDFQMIVPESNIKSSPTTYYFYTEIAS